MTREFVHVLNLILFFRIFCRMQEAQLPLQPIQSPFLRFLQMHRTATNTATPMPPNKIQSKTFMLSLFPASYSRLPIRYTPNATSHAMPHCMITIPTACNAESISRLIAAIAATHGV